MSLLLDQKSTAVRSGDLPYQFSYVVILVVS